MIITKPDPKPRIEPNAEPAGAQASPGALHGQVWLTVQTLQAQQLIRGRNTGAGKRKITGLVRFADRLSVIWQAARNDDPYADWWLIKVHEALERVRNRVKTEQGTLEAKLAQLGTLQVSLVQSVMPYRIELRFANPYAYRGAQMIGEYDTLVRTLLTADHVGLLDRALKKDLLNTCVRRIRGVFELPLGYQFLGIDRAALKLGSGNARQACQGMGVVPEDVLSGAHQAPLTPRKIQFPGQAGKHIRVKPVEPALQAAVVQPANDAITGTG